MPLLLATRKGLHLTDGAAAPRPVGPSADVLALARCASDSSILYAATRSGAVLRSDDGGGSWAERGAISGFGELSCLAAHPQDPDLLLAGMEPSALFRSVDGGRTWTEIPAIREMSEAHHWSVPWSDAKGHVRGVSIDPNDPGRIYLAIEVGGVVLTEDDGETWENVHGGIHDDVHSIAVNPVNDSVVYAATRHGFGRSDDHGRTWRRCDTFEGQGYARPLAVDPSRPDRVFTAAATVGPGGFGRPDVGAECGIYRTGDGGRSWAHLTNGLPARFAPYVDAIDVDPVAPDHVVLADTEGHLYETSDGGDAWHAAGAAPPVRRLLIV